MSSTGSGRPRGERLERGGQPAVGEDGGVDAARELAQLRERVRELLPGSGEDLVGAVGVVPQPRLREPQRERERDEPLLRAVVQVPLEPAALVVAGLDDPRARGAQLRLLRLALGHVGAADDELVGRSGERPQPPGDDPPVARPADPGGLVLEADPALDLLLERLLHLGDELGRRDEIPELRADRVLVAVPHELAERVVDALGRDRPVALHRDQKARRRAADRRQEVALRLDLVALRDELGQILAADQVAEVPLAVDDPAHVGRDEDPPPVRREPVRVPVDLLGALVHAPEVDLRALGGSPRGGRRPTRACRARARRR